MQAVAQKQRGIRVSARKEVIEQNRLRNGFERKLRKQLSALFAKIGRAAEREYVRHGRLLRSLQSIEPQLYDALESHYRAVINEFGLRIIRDAKADTQFEFLVRDYLRVHGGTRIQQVSETTRRQIMNAVQMADEEGLGVQVTGKRIFDRMSGSFSRYRAATIARTETHTAASYANDAVNRSLNIPNQIKRWVSVADLRTRPEHRAANGTEVPLDEDFIIGGVPMAYTGDPKGGAKNVINCRCVTLYITPEDEVQDDVPSVAPPKDQWGPVNDLERPFHELSEWNVDGKQPYTRNIIAAIPLTKAIPEIIYAKSGYMKGNGQGVSCGVSEKWMKEQTQLQISRRGTWRHEYGHFIDYHKGRQLNEGADAGKPFISRAVAGNMLEDRKPLAGSKQRAASVKAIDELDDLLADLTGKRPTSNLERLEALQGVDALPDFSEGLIRQLLNSANVPFSVDTLDALTRVGGSNPLIGGGRAMSFVDYVNKNKRGFISFVADLRAGYHNQGQGSLGFLSSLHPQSGKFTDYLEAISNGSIGWGHGKAYLKKFTTVRRGVTIGNTTEAMANYTALLGGPEAEAWRELMMWLAPSTTRKFDNIFEDISKSDPDVS